MLAHRKKLPASAKAPKPSASSTKMATIVALVGILSTTIGAAGTYFTIGREDRRVDLTETGADRDYLLKVTDKAMTMAVSENISERCLVTYLVATLPESYRDYRTGLLHAVEQADPTRANSFCVQNALDQIAQDREQAAQQTAPGPAGTQPPPAHATPPAIVGTSLTTQVVTTSAEGIFALDIFWCDGTGGPGRLTSASQLAERLKSIPNFRRIRVRPLPVSVNNQPSYRVNGNLIRYEPAEAKIAEALQNATNGDFTRQPITFNTPNYVSMFFCRGAQIGAAQGAVS